MSKTVVCWTLAGLFLISMATAVASSAHSQKATLRELHHVVHRHTATEDFSGHRDYEEYLRADPYGAVSLLLDYYRRSGVAINRLNQHMLKEVINAQLVLLADKGYSIDANTLAQLREEDVGDLPVALGAIHILSQNGEWQRVTGAFAKGNSTSVLNSVRQMRAQRLGLSSSYSVARLVVDHSHVSDTAEVRQRQLLRLAYDLVLTHFSGYAEDVASRGLTLQKGDNSDFDNALRVARDHAPMWMAAIYQYYRNLRHYRQDDAFSFLSPTAQRSLVLYVMAEVLRIGGQQNADGSWSLPSLGKSQLQDTLRIHPEDVSQLQIWTQRAFSESASGLARTAYQWFAPLISLSTPKAGHVDRLVSDLRRSARKLLDMAEQLEQMGQVGSSLDKTCGGSFQAPEGVVNLLRDRQ